MSSPGIKTSALHKRTGGGEERERASLNPQCWMKCLRKKFLQNFDAKLPVEAHDPPFKFRERIMHMWSTHIIELS